MRQNLYGFLQAKTYQYLNFWENCLDIRRGDYCCHYETRLVSINNIHVHDVKHGNNIISVSSYFVFVENEQTK
jgi:hypothetical protein